MYFGYVFSSFGAPSLENIRYIMLNPFKMSFGHVKLTIQFGGGLVWAVSQVIALCLYRLFEHSNDPDIDEPYTPLAGNELGSTEIPMTEVEEPPTDATPEDLCAGIFVLCLLRALGIQRLQQARVEREERERQAEVEREKQRRRDGQELGSARERLRDLEMHQLMEQRTREKQEEKLARCSPGAFIILFEATLYESPFLLQYPKLSHLPSLLLLCPYTTSQLQFRLPDGKQLTGVFGARESLASVRLYLNNFGLMTPFPRRVFTEDDMEKPLAELGNLVPSAGYVMPVSWR
uniref:UBX domain protein 1 n=1 Tax=Eptatretus burgeri TaxID=7764 RepID=A0A8C4QLD1_EPTBU